MVKLFGYINNMMANKVTIMMHIIAYLFIIFVKALKFVLYLEAGGRMKSLPLRFVFFYTLISGLVVNTMVTKI
jgi:hypothetical protein